MASTLFSLLLLTYATATLAGPSAVLLDFEKREIWHRSHALQRRDAAHASVFNAQSSLMYLVNVTVGTPPQNLQLQLDTGSSDIWIPFASATPCLTGRCIEGSFAPRKSKTFSVLDKGVFRIKYVDGTQIGGDYISDTFGIAGLSVDNMTMGLARAAMEQDSNGQFEGIIGLGFEKGESVYGQTGQTYPNLISKLKSQGIIGSRSYSLWLNDKSNGQGSILFGGIDTEKYHAPLIALPIQPDSRSNTVMSFTVALDRFFVRDAADSVAYSRTSLGLPVILDSGTTITYLPDPIAHDIYVGVGAVVSDTYGVVVPCAVEESPVTINFGFGNADGPVIAASLGQFVLPFPADLPRITFAATGDAACRLGLQAAAGRPLLFGDTFLRAAYVVYGIDAQHVALANARFNVSSGPAAKVVDLSGTGFPSALVSSTATGAAAFTAPAGAASAGAYGPNAVTFGAGAPADIATRPSGTFNLGTPTATRKPGSGHHKGGGGAPGSGGEKKNAAARDLVSPRLGFTAAVGVLAVVTSGVLFGGSVVVWRI